MAQTAVEVPSWQDYTSSIIFWFYIIGALYFSIQSILVIIKLSHNNKHSSAEQSRYKYGLVLFSGISFATLSANMLNILYRSYLRWAETHFITTTVLPRVETIWRWSLETKQFHEFIYALFEDRSGFVWSLAALAATFVICTYIGIEGKRHDIPKLWTFFGLSQILPISFTTSLFFLATLQSRRPVAAVKIRWTALVVAFIAFLLISSSCRLLIQGDESSQWLMPAVLTARSLLLVPYYAVKKVASGKDEELTSSDARKHLLTALLLILLALVTTEVSTLSQLNSDIVWQTLLYRPAVSTLGSDFVLTVIVCTLCQSLPTGIDNSQYLISRVKKSS